MSVVKNGAIDTGGSKSDIRWLTVDDYDIFAEHLALCGQKICEKIHMRIRISGKDGILRYLYRQ